MRGMRSLVAVLSVSIAGFVPAGVGGAAGTPKPPGFDPSTPMQTVSDSTARSAADVPKASNNPGPA